ncbi:hypothetical protein EDC04DRAFT_3139653 [Pisolithus marmoratus]|nr:hypothetical protein EDC04DRAFT_3139653 [Pisolithus marmoratus]
MFPSLPVLASLANVSTPFKRSSLGLFHGKLKQYGNNVPFSKKKTRRTWLPNVQNKRLMSEALGRKVELKVTTRALKTIKKHGGLDQYLLKTRPELLGYEGMRLRITVREALQAEADAQAEAKRVEEEAARLEKEKQLAEEQATRLASQKQLEAQRKVQAKKERRKSERLVASILGAQSKSSLPSESVR